MSLRDCALYWTGVLLGSHPVYVLRMKFIHGAHGRGGVASEQHYMLMPLLLLVTSFIPLRIMTTNLFNLPPWAQRFRYHVVCMWDKCVTGNGSVASVQYILECHFREADDEED